MTGEMIKIYGDHSVYLPEGEYKLKDLKNIIASMEEYKKAIDVQARRSLEKIKEVKNEKNKKGI